MCKRRKRTAWKFPLETQQTKYKPLCVKIVKNSKDDLSQVKLKLVLCVMKERATSTQKGINSTGKISLMRPARIFLRSPFCATLA